MRLTRGSRVTLTFELGRPVQRHIMQMLFNMSNRAVVGGHIVCKIGGVRQVWWDEQERQREEHAKRYAEARAESRKRNDAMIAEIRRDPNRSDADIAAIFGAHPGAIKELRRWAAQNAKGLVERTNVKQQSKTLLAGGLIVLTLLGAAVAGPLGAAFGA
jgi:hypothetical protein